MLHAAIAKKLQDFTLEANLDISSGVTAIFGPSGAGKSMLVKLLCGLKSPDEGLITLSGQTLFERQAGKAPMCSLPTHKRHIGFVFQDHRLFPHLTVRQNLTYGMEAKKSGPRNLSFEDVVTCLDIEPLLLRKPSQLSGGEQQRVAIGRALLANPDILIMDEPLSSLDQDRKDHILTLIERLRDQFSLNIIYITHSLDEVLRLADHLVLLEKGQIRAQGTVIDILSQHDLFPLSGDTELASVFSGTVLARDIALNITSIQTDAGEVLVTGLEQARTGTPVRIRLRARDIAISTSEHSTISTLNQFKGRITNIQDHSPGVVIISIDTGLPLLAAITVKSLHQLELQVGNTVWALVKSVTVNSVDR